MVINIRGIAKEYSIGATINYRIADQQAYTVTVYADNSNINIKHTQIVRYRNSFDNSIRQKSLSAVPNFAVNHAVMSAIKMPGKL